MEPRLDVKVGLGSLRKPTFGFVWLSSSKYPGVNWCRCRLFPPDVGYLSPDTDDGRVLFCVVPDLWGPQGVFSPLPHKGILKKEVV